MQFLEQCVPFRATDQFLEPSAGEGAFYTLLPADRRRGVDLEPKCEGVESGNFLTEGFPEFVRSTDGSYRWISVGNPPFGKNANLAVAFFQRAAEFSDVIAFIVPLTFKKESLQKRLCREFHLVGQLVLPKEAFTFEGQTYAVPCTFQVWVRDETHQRQLLNSPLSHPDFEFCDAAKAHFAIRRVGGLAGKVISNFGGYSPTSHYFIRSQIGKLLLKERIESIDWEDVKWNTAGNPSISKRELVAKYTQLLGNVTADAEACAA